MRNNRTDDRSGPLRGGGGPVAAAGARQGPKSRGDDRRRATSARPGDNETIPHAPPACPKNHSSFPRPAHRRRWSAPASSDRSIRTSILIRKWNEVGWL